MKVPTTIITGFLGAGKTTLIRHMLENNGGRRIALIINEFGDLGIDRGLLEGCGIADCDNENFVELANGCICCTVADDFLPTIGSLLEQKNPPEHIIIETSGLALPKPLVKAFNWPEIKSRSTVDGVIAVVDAMAVHEGKFAHDPLKVQSIRENDAMLDHESPLEEVFEDQVMCADLILLNKADLLSKAELKKTREVIESHMLDFVKIIDTSFGKVNPDVLLGLQANVEENVNDRKSHHDGEDDHDHDDFESFVIKISGSVDPMDFQERIQKVISNHDILRVKGFLNVKGKQMRSVIQGVGPRIEVYYDRPWQEREDRQTSIVLIGLAGLNKEAIRKNFSDL